MSKFSRISVLKEIGLFPKKEWDIVIIGGGASGLGTAVDSASRGYSTLLLEQSDFAKSTSSKSTKLVHGGVRYLAQGDLSLVFEALRERGILLQNAPHLVHNLQFVIPTYSWWDNTFYTVGMKIYDKMAGRLGLGPSVKINREEILKRLPNIEKEGLTGGVIYHDGQFDDARLAINLAQTAFEHGAKPLNYAEVTNISQGELGLTNGVSFVDTITGQDYKVRAKCVINATGVFSEKTCKLDSKAPAPSFKIKASQGVHIVLDNKFLKSDSAIMIPKTSDGRVLFAVPWYDKVLLGTTDTPVENISLEPKALEKEIDFILETAKHYLIEDPTRADILSVFAGLRPLVVPADANENSTKELSRSHQVHVSDSGLISLLGGKWTTYRKMAEDVVNQAQVLIGLESTPCATGSLKIHGYNISKVSKRTPLNSYGSDEERIAKLIEKNPGLSEKLHPNLPYQTAHVVWACRFEFAQTVEDVLCRRTRSLLLDANATISVSKKVANIMAAELGKNEEWEIDQISRFSKIADSYITF